MTFPTPPAHLPEARLAEIEARIAKATPGPWIDDGLDRFGDEFVRCVESTGESPDLVADIPTGEFEEDRASANSRAKADADLIAHSWEDLSALLLAVRAARAEIETAVLAERERCLTHLRTSIRHEKWQVERTEYYERQAHQHAADLLETIHDGLSLSLPEAATTDE